MSQVRKIAVAGGTFSVALGIGFVMQNGDALAARMGGGTPQVTVQDTVEVPALPAVAEASSLPTLPDFSDTPEEVVEVEFTPPTDVATPTMPELAVEMAAADATVMPTIEATPDVMADPAEETTLAAVEEDVMEGVEIAPLPEQDIAVTDCTPTLSSIANIAATVDLTLTAPCAANTGVTIHHQGMMFSLVTDLDGAATATVPALAETAVYIAEITGGEGAVTVISVPDVAMYDRAVLQWQGDSGLQMHAREFGAGYDDDGHVWQASMRDASATVMGDGGYMIRLGDPALDGGFLAEIYTYPSGMSSLSGSVDLTVEAEVTEANCGREIAAQSIQVSPGAEPFALDLEMTLPACDAVGEFLVLNNMLTDLTLASR